MKYERLAVMQRGLLPTAAKSHQSIKYGNFMSQKHVNKKKWQKKALIRVGAKRIKQLLRGFTGVAFAFPEIYPPFSRSVKVGTCAHVIAWNKI